MVVGVVVGVEAHSQESESWLLPSKCVALGESDLTFLCLSVPALKALSDPMPLE